MPPIRKVLIIYPPIVLSAPDRPSYTFPMGAGYIAAVLEQAGYQVQCLDAIAEGMKEQRPTRDGRTEFGLSIEVIMARVREFKPDAVGISCQFSLQFSATRKLLEAIHAWNAETVTVIGGTHSSAQPGAVLNETGVDYVILGEGEATIVELFARLNEQTDLSTMDGLAWRHGSNIRVNPRTQFIRDLDAIPFPARHLFDMEKYFETDRGWGDRQNRRRLSMITSRGCPFKCSFCGIHLNTGKTYRARSPENVLSEISKVIADYRITDIMFEDDNISLHKNRFLDILHGIIDHRFDITWTATSGMALWTLDEEVLQTMRESRCSCIYLGIESGNERVLREVIVKHLTDKNEIRRRVTQIKSFGFETVGFWVLGNPGETKKEMWDTLEFARELELDFNQVLIALPYKGTALYDTCLEKGYFAVSPELDPNQMMETKGLIRTPEFGPMDVFAIQQAGRFLAIRRKGTSRWHALRELFRRHGLSGARVLVELAKKKLGYYTFCH
jgi:magnesium-protoporphyrin IX monomethyl ester (oxidative) cyclase